MPKTISMTARLVSMDMPRLMRTTSRIPVAARPRLARLMQLNSMDMLTVRVCMNVSMTTPPS